MQLQTAIKNTEKEYKVKIPVSFINELAQVTQVCIKNEGPNYVHGHLLYAIIANYAKKQKHVTIFETGTARGFSAVVMAKALADAKVPGRVVTVDVLPVHQKIHWNCITDEKGKTNRMGLLNQWKDLLDH